MHGYKKTIFNSIQLQKQKKNVFDHAHDVRLSTQMGWLMPCMAVDLIPGDTAKLSSNAFVRFQALLAPIMHRVDVSLHYFFVPNRITWPEWPDFITQKTAYAAPTFTMTSGMSDDAKKMCDGLGIPPVPPGGTPTDVSALPLAAYQMIYHEYYRDENLVPEFNFELTPGSNTANTQLVELRRRAWEHDYFTAALPFAQKGGAVSIPLGEVELVDNWQNVGQPSFLNSIGGSDTGNVEQDGVPSITVSPGVGTNAYNPDGTLTVGDTTISDLRRAFKLQQFLEKNARGGTRYIEHILVHYGVASSDKRLQRPEYITGTRAPVVISEVLNTTGTADAPQGEMAGHGVSVNNGHLGAYYAEEFGWLIGVISVMPKPAYQQGIPKSFLRTDPLDYYYPDFATIGEQEVKLKELYAYDVNSENLFGYVPRYAEYKYTASRVTGDLRESLDFWHLGRKFATPPTLSQDFIEMSPSQANRVFAVQDGTDNIIAHVVHNLKLIRGMPVFSNPGI